MLKRIEWYLWDMGLPWGRVSLPVQTFVTTVTEAPLALRYAWSFDLGIRFVRRLDRPGEKITFGLALEDLAGHIWENAQTIARIPTVTRLGQPTPSISIQPYLEILYCITTHVLPLENACAHTSVSNVGCSGKDWDCGSDTQQFPVGSQRGNGQQV